MQKSILLLALAAGLAPAQDYWRRELTGLPAQADPNVSVADIERIEQNAAYLASVDVVTRNPRVRAALGQAFVSVAALQWMLPPAGLLGGRPAPAPPAPAANRPVPPPAEPRFALEAPDVTGAPAADRERANDLAGRYDSAAAQAAAAWRSAGRLRQSLQTRGMTLNALTETSLARLQLYLDLAAGHLQNRQWDDAKTNIDRAAYETTKVLNAVGR
jgi:hypothetical protein